MFAQRVAAIAGQDVEQVVRVSQPVAIKLDHIVEARLGAAELHRFIDQPLRRQPFAFHEIDIDATDAAFGQFAQRVMIVEHRRQIGAIGQDLLTFRGREETRDRPFEPIVAQRVENVKHLFGVLLVGDQLAEMVQRLQRAEAGVCAVGVDQRDSGHGVSLAVGAVKSRSSHY